jgi:hypothetical protein
MHHNHSAIVRFGIVDNTSRFVREWLCSGDLRRRIDVALTSAIMGSLTHRLVASLQVLHPASCKEF